MIKLNKNIVLQNEEELLRLQFAIQNRTTPTIVFIVCDDDKTKKQFVTEVNNNNNYEKKQFDLSDISVNSLGRFLSENLGEEIIKEAEKINHLVHLFGLEYNIIEATKQQLGVKDLAKTINLEREMLFRKFPIVLMIWTNQLTVFQLQKYAPDFWDWVTNSFHFKNPEILEPDYDLVIEPIDSNYIEEEDREEQLLYIEELKERLKGLDKYETDRSKRNELSILKAIGNAYKQIEEWEKAAKYFENGATILNTIKQKIERESIAINIYIAQCLVECKQYKKAGEVLEHFFATNDDVAKAELFLEYGKVKEKSLDIKCAAQYYKQSIELLKNA